MATLAVGVSSTGIAANDPATGAGGPPGAVRTHEHRPVFTNAAVDPGKQTRSQLTNEAMQGKITDEDATELVGNTADAASAYIRGDIQKYLTLIQHGDNYTLMAPYGGEPRLGFDVMEALETMPRMFRGGEAELELVETYASGDMAVLVAIERQHGEVGGMPDQDWSLRVTLVFQHEGTEWQLVHRHADPLVHAISMEHMAVLARGHS